MAAARFLLLLVGAFLLLSWARADHNPILLVTDRARSLDSSLFAGVLGRTHDALRFARFARRLRSSLSLSPPSDLLWLIRRRSHAYWQVREVLRQRGGDSEAVRGVLGELGVYPVHQQEGTTVPARDQP